MRRSKSLNLYSLIAVVFLLLMLTVGFSTGQLGIIANSAVQTENTSDDINENYAISYEKGKRYESIVDYDATDNYVFFAYSEKTSVVDAYNMNGDYAFSIIFGFREKGSISIRCEGNFLYVFTKYGNVFIFENDYCVKAIEANSASEQGYGWKWFENKQREIRLNGFTLQRHGSEDNIRIPIPIDILWGLYSRYFIILVIILAIILQIFRSGLFKKTKITSLYKR